LFKENIQNILVSFYERVKSKKELNVIADLIEKNNKTVILFTDKKYSLFLECKNKKNNEYINM